MYTLRDIVSPADRARATALLHSHGLQYPDNIEYGVGVYCGETLSATGFLGAGRLMGLCVEAERRGEGLALLLVDHLLKEALAVGYGHLFIFTKAIEAASFAATGFELLAATKGTQGVALLEWGSPQLADWLHSVCEAARNQGYNKACMNLCDKTCTKACDCANSNSNSDSDNNSSNTDSKGTKIGAVVVNANPLTRGHVWLLEQAAAQCELLYVFVVQEDVSAFSFATRLQLVRQGSSHLTNCMVLPAGPYIISRHTFPTYFTGEAGQAAAHAALDATLFASRIAPALGITTRFVGSEPFSPVTAFYNAHLREILTTHGLLFHELPRLEEQTIPISASRLRALLATGNLAAACALSPPCTADFLHSEQGLALAQALSRS